MGKKFGNALIFGVITVLTGLINAGLGLAEWDSLSTLSYFRILVGFLQGGSYPLLHGLWKDYADPTEISTIVS